MTGWPKPCAEIFGARRVQTRGISASQPPMLPRWQKPPSEQHRSPDLRQIGLDRMIDLMNEEQPVEAMKALQLGNREPEWNDIPPVALGQKKHTHICGDEEMPALALCWGMEYHFYPPDAVSMGMFLP